MQSPFDAIADPTRRVLLERLRTGGALSLTELSDGLPITRQATTKHLDALARAGLVRVRRAGRERLHELDPAPLRAIDDWLKPYSAAWDDALERLRRHIEEGTMTDLATSGLTIRKSIELRAPIERVWRARTDAAELARWLPQAADLEPGAGSEGWFDWGEFGRYAVRVESVEAPTRVVWRWAREADVRVADADQSTTVEWTLTALADGRTRLDLYEWGFVDPAHQRGNSDGWDEELAELRTIVEA